MKYHLKGKGAITLTKQHFLASGGEGSVYVRAGTAYKIYTNSSNMISDGKIAHLSSISSDHVIKPENILLNGKNSVGYSMKFVPDTEPLVKLFAPAYKKRTGISLESILKLVESTQGTLQSIHDADVLVVDLNEMNVLVGKNHEEGFYIDVDSYQTRGYPATALMDSVKDWHAKGKWTEGSDWFSWAVISFQLFTGIHPYKGKYKPVRKMPDRMQKNISVFNKDVRVPKTVPDFGIIPEAYRDWYQAVFDRGLRVKPPSGRYKVGVMPSARAISSSGGLSIKLCEEFSTEVNWFKIINGSPIAETTEGIVYKKRVIPELKGSVVGETPRGVVVAANIKYGKVELRRVDNLKLIESDIEATNIMGHDNRIYVQYSGQISEIDFLEVGGDVIPASKLLSSVLPSATKFFPGVAIQDMLGSWYATMFPCSGESYEVQLRELVGYKVVDSKADGSVLVVVATKKGQYDQFIFKFDKQYSGYKCTVEKDVTYAGVNFIALDTGVCAMVSDEEDLILFAASPKQDAMKKIHSDSVSHNLKLCKKPGKVLGIYGRKVYEISSTK